MNKHKLYPRAPIICEGRDNMSDLMYIIGWLGRCAVHFACTYGSVAFLADAFGITSPSAENAPRASLGIIALVCLFISAAASVASVNKKALLCTLPVALGGFAGFLCIFGNPITLLSDGIRCVIDTALYRMAEAGYFTFSSYVSGRGFSYDIPLCLNVGMSVIAVFFGILFGFFIIKKARTLPCVIICVATLVPIFVYNLTRTNSGISAAVVFIVSALSLCLFDRRYSGREFSFVARREKKEMRRAARRKKKDERKRAWLLLKKKARVAYESAYIVSDDRRTAAAARRAVYLLDAEEKRNRRKALAESLKKERKEAKKQKKLDRISEKKAKAQKKKDIRRNAALSRKNPELKKQLDSAKKAASKRKKEQNLQRKEQLHRENDKKRRNIASGGLCGLCALILALSSVFLPSTAVSGVFPVIGSIYGPLSTVSTYVSAYLTGDDLDLNDLSMYGNLAELAPRTLSFDPLSFEGTQMFFVSTSSKNPVYLRSWLTGDYDNEGGVWKGESADSVVDFRSEFGKEFTPDSLKTEFFSYMFPTSVDMIKEDMFMDFSAYGFLVQQVNMRRVNYESKLIFTPATVNTDYMLMKYASLDPIDVKYSYFYDGMYSSRFFDTDVPYTTASFLAKLNDPTLAENIAEQTEYFELALEYINAFERINETLRIIEDDKYYDLTASVRDVSVKFHVSTSDVSDVEAKFDEDVKARGIYHMGDSIVQRYLDSDAEGREKLYSFLEQEKKYRTYASEKYTKKIGGENIAQLSEDLLTEAGYTKITDRDGNLKYFADSEGGRVPDGKIIRLAIDYLTENYTYTLTPKAPEGGTDDVLSSFLFDVKEGYCTHFATAAAAILRNYGYSVRYCEGYIADGFQRDYAKGAPSKYYTYALDEDAHAWIEVYLPYFGWMQYEATPKYAETVYSPEFDPTAQSPEEIEREHRIDVTGEHTKNEQELVPPQVQEPEPEVPVEEITDRQVRRFIEILAICAAAVAVFVFILRLIFTLLKKRAAAQCDIRRNTVDEGLSVEKRTGMRRENRTLALSVNDMLMTYLSISGYVPEDGEGVAEFSARLEESFGGISDTPIARTFGYMMKAEFGTELEGEELYAICDLTSRISSSVYNGLSPMGKFYWRYIKRMI